MESKATLLIRIVPFESMKLEDIEKVAKAEGIADYNVTDNSHSGKAANFQRIEDPDVDQTNDFKGVALVGDRKMGLNANVLSGNVSIKEGRMAEEGDENVCVISEELAEKNQLKVGDSIRFCPLDTEESVTEGKGHRYLYCERKDASLYDPGYVPV